MSAAYHRGTVFAAACIGMLLFGTTTVSLGTINAYLSAKFALNQLAVGSLAALLPFGILGGSVVFGPVVDRYGYRVPMIGSSLVILAGFEAIAFTDRFLLIQASFFLIGLGGGILNGGTNALVADISADQKGASLSLLGVFFGVGALGMPMATGLLLSALPFEIIIAGIGLTVLFPILLFALIALPPAKHAQGIPFAESVRLLNNPLLLLFGMVLFFQSGLEGMTNNWATAYLQGSAGLPVAQSLMALTAMAASLTAARLLLGVLLKRLPSAPVTLGSLAFTFSGILLLAWAPSTASAVIALALIGIGFAPVFPVLLGLVAERFAAFSGTAIGIALVIALAGNTALNYLVGVVVQDAGLTAYPWMMLGSACFLLALLSLALRRQASRP
jgi:fucose permease